MLVRLRYYDPDDIDTGTECLNDFDKQFPLWRLSSYPAITFQDFLTYTKTGSRNNYRFRINGVNLSMVCLDRFSLAVQGASKNISHDL